MTEGFERIPDRTRDECGDGERAAAPTHPRYENGFGERLRMVREGAGYTQAYLADLCRLPASAISHFESGRRMPSADSLRRVAIGLNVSADVLLDITAAGDREPQPFERYPALASWIERFAGLPLQGISLGDWCVFIGALNSAILRAERGSGSTSVAATVGPADPGGFKMTEAQPKDGEGAEALLPCPFCGGLALSVQRVGRSWEIGCDDCDGAGPLMGSPEQAIAAWNRRAPPATPVRGGGNQELSVSQSQPGYDGERAASAGAEPSAAWRPIASAPSGDVLRFWPEGNGVPAMVDVGEAKAHGRYRKPTHWMPLPSPPSEAARPLGGPTGAWRNNEDGESADGGFSYVKHLFRPREVTRLSVPGMVNGVQIIEVGFADGMTVTVDAYSIGAAWEKLETAAKSLSPPPPVGGDGEGSSCAMSGGTASPKSESAEGH